MPSLQDLIKQKKKKLESKKIQEEKKEIKISIKKPIEKIVPIYSLNEENLIRFIKEQEKTKPYEMKIRFFESSSFEIQKLLNHLFKKGLLERNRNSWISLKK